jgi:SAM-dependent methyltransferase
MILPAEARSGFTAVRPPETDDWSHLPLRAVAAAAYRGERPRRYDGYPASFRLPFDAALGRVLAPGQRILDVGGGRTPTVDAALRPPGCRYVGCDIAGAELALAGAGYDESVVVDATRFEPALVESFDVVLSFQALEHVRPLPAAIECIRRYLRPGGQLVAQLSGAFAAYSLVARVTPRRLTEWAQLRLYGRAPETVFRPSYHRCWSDALERMLEPWAEATVTPLWIAEPYFHFSPHLRGAYLAYEEWARRGGRRNLAPYYLLVATR